MKKLKIFAMLMLVLPVALIFTACGPTTSSGGENEWKWVVQNSPDATSDVVLQNPWDDMETDSKHGEYRGSVGLVKVEGLSENEYAILTLKLDVNLSDYDTEATQNDKIGFEVTNVHSTESKPELYFSHWNTIGNEYPTKTNVVALQGNSTATYFKFFNVDNYVTGDAIIVDVTKDIGINFSYMSTDGTIKDITVLIEAAKITGK